MSRYAAFVLVLLVIGLAPGCGSGNEPSNPQAPPPNFDPGGGAKPDMTGESAQPKS